jgi:hypothetical protein
MAAKEGTKAVFSLWAVFKMDPQVYGVLGVALVATKVDFVSRHVTYGCYPDVELEEYNC